MRGQLREKKGLAIHQEFSSRPHRPAKNANLVQKESIFNTKVGRYGGQVKRPEKNKEITKPPEDRRFHDRCTKMFFGGENFVSGVEGLLSGTLTKKNECGDTLQTTETTKRGETIYCGQGRGVMALERGKECKGRTKS